MLGDFILWIEKVLKQQSCIHNYTWRNTMQLGNCSSFECCTKCDRNRL